MPGLSPGAVQDNFVQQRAHAVRPYLHRVRPLVLGFQRAAVFTDQVHTLTPQLTHILDGLGLGQPIGQRQQTRRLIADRTQLGRRQPKTVRGTFLTGGGSENRLVTTGRRRRTWSWRHLTGTWPWFDYGVVVHLIVPGRVSSGKATGYWRMAQSSSFRPG